MVDDIASRANRLKQLAGSDLQGYLIETFSVLKNENIILDFNINQNFSHQGFSYNKQYLANFIIETLDNKFIVINSSNSYRHDRMKLQAYDLEGVTKNASISDRIIASILLYPDTELENPSLIKFRNNVISKDAYSPATHILVISELVDFLENHKDFVEEQKSIEAEEINEVKNGSYYGLRGNAFENEVVDILNNPIYIGQLKANRRPRSVIFDSIMSKILSDYSLTHNDIISIHASNTVLKLRSGGNAKTDIIITLKTITTEIIETISVKNTTQTRVSCHDYKSSDFIRVLQVENSPLSYYLDLYQSCGSHKSFVESMRGNVNLERFIELLSPYKETLLEWALTGDHDHDNLIDPIKQISNYLLINKLGVIKFIDFSSYMEELYDSNIKLSYGLPLGWTYPSKQRGVRIQLKLPIIL